VSEPKHIVAGVDHLIVMVRDLDRSERGWQRLGFAPTPRGFHQSGGTANHLIMLDRTYVELLGMTDPAAASPYRAMLDQAPGLWGIAWRASAEATFRFWRERALEPTAPTSLARGVEIHGRRELARFALTMLPHTTDLPCLLFCCEQLTPRFVWHEDLPAHPNSARSLREVLVLVDDARAAGQLERVTGQQAVAIAEGSVALTVGECRIVLLTEAAFAQRFGPQVRFAARTRPVLAGFTLATGDLTRAREFAQQAGLATQPTAAGGFHTYVADEGVLIEWAPLR
jgi:hypothetical protein